MTSLIPRFGRAGSVVICGLIFIAIIAVGAWAAIAKLDAIINRAVTVASNERDSYWRSHIDQANLLAAKNIIEQQRQSARIESAAQATINTLKDQLTELEVANAAIPDDPSCGIDRDRIRLLRNPAQK